MRATADLDFACLEGCSVLLDCCYLVEILCKLHVHFGFSIVSLLKSKKLQLKLILTLCYLLWYTQNITILAGSPCKIIEYFIFFFILSLLNAQYTAQSGLATFWMLSNHASFMPLILDSAALDHSSWWLWAWTKANLLSQRWQFKCSKFKRQLSVSSWKTVRPCQR